MTKLSQFITTAAERTGLTVDDIMGPCRKHHIVVVRFCIMDIMKSRYNMTLSEIGWIFNRDHSSIIHAIRTARNYEQTGYDRYLKTKDALLGGTDREGSSCFNCYGVTVSRFYYAN